MLTYTLVQVRAFSEAIERQERLRLSAKFTLLLTSSRGEREDIKQLLKLLGTP